MDDYLSIFHDGGTVWTRIDGDSLTSHRIFPLNEFCLNEIRSLANKLAPPVIRKCGTTGPHANQSEKLHDSPIDRFAAPRSVGANDTLTCHGAESRDFGAT